jgi:lipopolysaccharide/colanic/teichoic acid biosynthesis glycosyltransferase
MNLIDSDMSRPAHGTQAGPRAGGVGYGGWKPALDGVAALALLVLTAPIVIVAMVLVRLTSRGPALYTQERLGLDGEIFTIYKIRTMHQHSERHSGATWSLPGDRRVTPVGRVLRSTHLDELPQLLNVLRGEMSLVGPRPERPEFLARLARAFPDYRRRLAVRPGVTGLAQVQQPPDTDLEGVRRKLAYDLCYVDGLSPWLDLRIVLATLLHCLGVPFAWIGVVLRLPDPIGPFGPDLPSRKETIRPEALALEAHPGAGYSITIMVG